MEDASVEIILIYISVLIALLWALLNALVIKGVKVSGQTIHENSEDKSLFDNKKLEMIELIGDRISNGANAFLFQEYTVMCIFIVIFGIIILVVVDIFGHGETAFRAYATIAFVIGSLTSMLCGFIGMRIAVASNYRTTFMAM